MFIHEKNAYSKIQKQISKLEDAKIKIRIQIDCMSSDVSIRAYSRVTYNARRKHLEGALNAIIEHIMFLNNLLEVLEVKMNEKSYKANFTLQA